MKYYAVKSEENRIFTSWDECKSFLDGKKAYKYKGFSSLAEAEAFLRGVDLYAEAVKKDLADGYCVCFTDGSYDERYNAYSYGVVAIGLDGKEYEFCDRGEVDEYLTSRNVAGEADGVLCAAKWAYLNGYAKLKIYHDYAGLSAWANGEWSARSPVAEYYSRELSRYRGVLRIEFVKVKGHGNVSYNERVDKLAKKALFDGFVSRVSGYGFKLSGDGEAKNLAERVHVLAARAEHVFTDDGTVFTLGDDRLAIRVCDGATAITGTGGVLYFLAVSELSKTRDRLAKIRLYENAFSLTDLASGDGVTVSTALLNKGEFEPNLCVLFALDEVVEVIKRGLKDNNIVCEKPSQVFIKRGDGDFELNREIEPTEKKRLEYAYGFLYEYRTGYGKKPLTELDARRIIGEAKDIVGERNDG